MRLHINQQLRASRLPRGLLWDQGGITGLETAIVLIAFVVVASVFAFAILSSGLLASEKSQETILGGLEETGASIAIRGSVVAFSTSSNTAIDYVIFQVNNASQTGDDVELSGTDTIVAYTDSAQAQTNLTYLPNILTSTVSVCI